MLGSIPLIAGLGLLLLVLVAAYALIPPKRKETLAAAIVPPAWHTAPAPPPEPVRMRSYREMEIDEDADLVAAHYRQTAREAYTQAALARHLESLQRGLSVANPSTKGKSTA